MKCLLFKVWLLLLLPFWAVAELAVHFIDVGQGDAILVEHQQTNVLIDGGDRGQEVEAKLLGYLRSRNVNSIEAIISTHPHADHIGGLSAVMDHFSVKAAYDPGIAHTTRTFENYLLKIDALDIPYCTPRRGETIRAGDLAFEVLHPVDDVEQFGLNDGSIVLRLTYGDVAFLFAGDVEHIAEQHILDAGMDVKATVLKVAHHGSRTSTKSAFLAAVDPEVAVIMCGTGNRFAHPHGLTISALHGRGIGVYRTDLHGDIVVRTDGRTYQVQTSRSVATEANAQPPNEPMRPDADDGRININTATLEQLQQITGVGPAIAQRIIDFRTQRDPFQRIEDIQRVLGIAAGRFANMKTEIKVRD